MSLMSFIVNEAASEIGVCLLLMLIRRSSKKKLYYDPIYFPSGAWVKAEIGGPYMNIYVQAPEDDFGKTEGLCGTFDRTTENDLTGKDGHVHPHAAFPDAFTESWRIPPGMSYFDQPYQPDPKWNNQLKYCNCDQAKHLVDCRIDNKANDPAKQTRCPNCQTVKQSTRRRRDVTGLPNEDSDNDEFYLFDYGYSFVRVISSFPTRSGRTESSARDLCQDALSRMTVIKQCQYYLGFDIDSFVEYCVEDIKNTDDLSYINGVKQSAVMACMQLALKNVSLYDSQTGQPPAFITTDLCPYDCNGNGNCVRGTCHCNSGFTGADCSIDATKPPTINEVIKGNTCDIRQRPCRTIYVAGNNILNFASTRCRLGEMEFRNGNFASTGKTLDVTMQFESSFHAGCNMPVKTSVGGKTVVGYKIALTNDGHQFSNEKEIFIYDSHCMNCAITGSCTVKI
ncbi:hypothetical protein CHS0354_038959 [Potamilus streckersoni]|uniref:VWFD domain-containing protein n=1 Tax=Potamilus streckersoni TaxID=2493646 RepID=A0AAE0S136_9BIVA|nr:hypothetical protein CHS0354_038959 [Potamilus streckersoni]